MTGVPRVQDEGELQCRVDVRGSWTILVFSGELDFTHMDTARKALAGLMPAHRGGLALDLRGLTFMDTCGVRLVLQAMHRAEACAAEFALVEGSFEVQRVLELVGLTDQMRIVEDPSRLERPPARGHAKGIFAGVSSGAIASIAVRTARELDGGNVVLMVCDDGWKYLSSGLYTRPLEEVACVDSTAWW